MNQVATKIMEIKNSEGPATIFVRSWLLEPKGAKSELGVLVGTR